MDQRKEEAKDDGVPTEKRSQQAPDSGEAPSSQQPGVSLTSGVATPSTMVTQPTSPGQAGQQQGVEPVAVQQPQALSPHQPKLDASPQLSHFSKDMNCDSLAVWLTNHPKLMGEGYLQDISKLKDARINGAVFRSLNDSMLERSGVTLGFQLAIKNIIEELADYERRLLQLCREGCKADISQFRQLLRQGVDVNVYDEDGKHPLWRASYLGREDLVLLLLEYKAVVDQPTKDGIFGDTALLAASSQGHIKCATVLLKHRADINYGNKVGCTALYNACCENHPEVVNMLLDKGASVNKGVQSPLYAAAHRGYLPIVEMLVRRGAVIDKPCDEAPCATPLLIACEHNHPQVASYLISKGAGVNNKTKNGYTPLHAACLKGHRAVVKVLIESQAKLEIKTNDGDTPLDIAKRKGYSEIVTLLERADHTSSAEDEEPSSDVQEEEEKPFVAYAPPSAPTMRLLTKWKVLSSVAANWRSLADILGFDPSVTSAIDGRHRGDPDLSCRELFTRWLKGEAGSAPSWDDLLEALDGLSLKVLADDLRSKLCA